MPKNNPEHQQLRRELYEAIQSSWHRAGKIIPILKKIAALNDPDFITDIVSLLWAEEKEVVFETSATIALLIQRVPVGDLPTFDTQIRSRWPYWTDSDSLNTPQLELLKSSTSWWETFGVLASHRSGFVRQAAVEELAGEDSGEELPFLLLRTTDWVEPVRKAAEESFRQKLNQKFSNQLAKCLPLVFRLRSALRNQPKALLDEIEKIVASRPDFLSTNFYAGIAPAFLRYRFKLAKSYGAISLDRLIALAIDSSDPGVRMLACDWLNDETASLALRTKYSDVLFADKSALVRVRAFWRIANAFPEQYQGQIERALIDPSTAVQDTARGAWRLLLHRDSLAFYRQRAVTAIRSSEVIAVLRGLRAEGTIVDEALARPFLQHSSVKIRREALRTLVTWNVHDTTALLHDSLLGKTPSYAKEAAQLFLGRLNLLSVSLVKELLNKPTHPDSRKIALWLLVKMPKWSSLPLILLAYAIPSCRNQAERAFRDWNRNYNRVQSSPSKLEATEAVSAFRGITDLPLATNRELAAIIRDLEKLDK